MLTAEELSLAGTYTVQLRGKNGDAVRHSSVAVMKIPASLGGGAHWTGVPKVIETAVDTAVNAANTAVAASQSANSASQTATAAQSGAVAAAESAEQSKNNAGTYAESALTAREAIEAMTANAAVDSGVGTPSVEVTSSIVSGHRVFYFNFHNLKGADGQDGADGRDGIDGQDGYSPTIAVTDITGGHRVTITDKNGTRQFDVMDGETPDMSEYRTASAQDEIDAGKADDADVIKGVKIAGTELTKDAEGKVDVPIGSDSAFGVFLTGGAGVRSTAGGQLYIQNSSNSEISARQVTTKPIVPATLNYAVKSALSDANRINNMTEAEKANARGVIGAASADSLDLLWKYAEGNIYSAETDTAEAYAKTIKSGVVAEGNKALVNSFGGKSVVLNQICPLTSETETKNGVTFVHNSANNTWTANGTATNRVLYAVSTIIPYVNGHKYATFGNAENATVNVCINTNGSPRLQSIDIFQIANNENKGFYFDIANGYTCENVVFKPRLVDLTLAFGSGNEPSSADDYRIQMLQRYFDSNPSYYNLGEIVSAEVQNVVSRGLNLYDIDKGVSDNGALVKNQDGTWTLSKTASGRYSNFVTLTEPIKAGEHWVTDVGIVSGSISGNFSIQVRYSDGTGGSSPIDSYSRIAAKDIVSVRIYGESSIPDGTTCVINRFGIAKSNSHITIPNFKEPISLPIPSAIKSLDGYGWSAGSAYNEVDFARKKFVKRVGRVAWGDLNWFLASSYGEHCFQTNSIPIDHSNPLVVVNEKGYSVTTNTFLNMSDRTLRSTKTEKSLLVVKDSAYSNADDFKESLSDYLYYELATPIETDISAYITDDSIPVESGGTVTFEQQTGVELPVPNSISYLRKIEEAI